MSPSDATADLLPDVLDTEMFDHDAIRERASGGVGDGVGSQVGDGVVPSTRCVLLSRTSAAMKKQYVGCGHIVCTMPVAARVCLQRVPARGSRRSCRRSCVVRSALGVWV